MIKKKNEYGHELEVINVRLVKEPSFISETPIKTQSDAVNVVKDFLSQYDREVFCVLNLASDGKPIGINIASIGTLNAALVSPRDVFKSSILCNAAGFIAFHCHPSGNPKPSREDAETTQKLRDAGGLLDITMLDHIIVGCGNRRSFSFAGHNLLKGRNLVAAYERYEKEHSYER